MNNISYTLHEVEEIKHEYSKEIAVLEWRVKYWKTNALIYGWTLITMSVCLVAFAISEIYSAKRINQQKLGFCRDWLESKEKLGWKCVPLNVPLGIPLKKAK